jgi:alpha-tubulin suppressor-like RCC1 family protein
MPNRIYTNIEILPNAQTLALSSQLAIHNGIDSFALHLSTINALMRNTINPPLSAQLDSLSSTAYPAITALMPLAGGKLTGSLTLHTVEPLDALHIASKRYVDDADALHVAGAGDALTGFLSAHADPNKNTEVARKQYVDAQDSNIDYIIGVNFSGFKVSRFAFSERNQSVDAGFAGKFFVVDNSNRLKFIGSDGDSYAGGGTGPFDQRFASAVVCSVPFVSSGEFAISAAGDANFSIILSNYGYVYTTGSNKDGQLGNGTTVARLTWELINPAYFGNVPVIKIFLSDATNELSSRTGILAITQNGNLYGWGANDNFQLSLSAAAFYTTPRRINTPSNPHGGSVKNILVKDAMLTGRGNALAQFSAVIDINNQVHAVGNGNAMLPIGTNTSGTSTSFSACKVIVSGSTEVNMTADAIYGSGSSNVYAVTAGQLYAAGANIHGQLLNGLNATTSKRFAKCQLAEDVDINGNAVRQRFADDVAFVKTIAGTNNAGNATTVYVVTNSGQVYSGGYNRVASGHARAIASKSKFLKAAIPVASLAGKNIVQLKACNSNFDRSVCIVQDVLGNLYSVGWNDFGIRGNGNLRTTDGFALVIAPNNVVWSDYIVMCSKAANLTNNEPHAHAYTTSGELYSWGYNGFGECGVFAQQGVGTASTNTVISSPIKTSIA